MLLNKFKTPTVEETRILNNIKYFFETRQIKLDKLEMGTEIKQEEVLAHLHQLSFSQIKLFAERLAIKLELTPNYFEQESIPDSSTDKTVCCFNTFDLYYNKGYIKNKKEFEHIDKVIDLILEMEEMLENATSK